MEVRGSSITMALVDKPQPHEKARLGEVKNSNECMSMHATAHCAGLTESPDDIFNQINSE